MSQGQPPWDVLIAGAGPSGSSLACSLLTGGPALRVCLLDRQVFPRDKACGDGIGPGVVRILQQLNLLSVCEGFEPVELVRLRSPSGREMVSQLPIIDGGKPIGYVIPRLTFDNRLMAAAVARGATDRTGYGVIGAEFNSATSRWEVQVRRDIGGERHEETIEARILIGADGARSTVRRILGVPFNSPKHTGISIRQYATIDDGSAKALEFDFLPAIHPAYGWYFAASDRRANIGVVCDVPVYTRRKLDLDRLLDDHCHTLERHHRVTYAPDSRKSYILPYGSELPRLSLRRAALVGDAASMINPATGEGLYYGIYAGVLLGSLLRDAYAGHYDVDTALKRYSTEFHRRFRRHYRSNHLLKRLVASPLGARIAFRAAGADPRILTDAVRLFMGDGKALSPLSMLRILAQGF